MKSLYRIFFCMFTIAIFSSCEPEEISSDIQAEGNDTYMGTGNQEGDIIE